MAPKPRSIDRSSPRPFQTPSLLYKQGLNKRGSDPSSRKRSNAIATQGVRLPLAVPRNRESKKTVKGRLDLAKLISAAFRDLERIDRQREARVAREKTAVKRSRRAGHVFNQTAPVAQPVSVAPKGRRPPSYVARLAKRAAKRAALAERQVVSVLTIERRVVQDLTIQCNCNRGEGFGAALQSVASGSSFTAVPPPMTQVVRAGQYEMPVEARLPQVGSRVGPPRPDYLRLDWTDVVILCDLQLSESRYTRPGEIQVDVSFASLNLQRPDGRRVGSADRARSWARESNFSATLSFPGWSVPTNTDAFDRALSTRDLRGPPFPQILARYFTQQQLSPLVKVPPGHLHVENLYAAQRDPEF